MIVLIDLNFSVFEGPKLMVDFRLKSTRSRVQLMRLRVTITRRDGYPGGNLQPAWCRASSVEGFAVLAWYSHNSGISTAYHRRGSKR